MLVVVVVVVVRSIAQVEGAKVTLTSSLRTSVDGGLSDDDD